MKQRQAQFWVWWLLPFLAARALVPVGFMAQLHHGQVQMVLCSGGFAKVANTPDGNPELAHDHDNTAGHTVCPFAGSASAPLPVALVLMAVSHARADIPVQSYQSPPFAARFISGHAIRGPPVLS